MQTLEFAAPWAWQFGLPCLLVILAAQVWTTRRRGLSKGQISGLAALRGVAFILLIFLAARPSWVSKDRGATGRNSLLLLVDASESMALEEGNRTRYRQAIDFAQDHLLPALKRAGWNWEPFYFAETITKITQSDWRAKAPDGKRSNLAEAIARGLNSMARPPWAIIALTDGAANVSENNSQALAALTEAQSPFIGIGFGSDTAAPSLALRQVEAPATVAPNQTFPVTASLEMINADHLSSFELLLMRDGKLCQKKTVEPGTGSREWLENFRVTETNEGVHQYTVQMAGGMREKVLTPSRTGHVSVRVSAEKEIRILYAQGSLTWDYKFINLALKQDPFMKMTGLTRTGDQLVFRQNVESEGELLTGFPTSLPEFAPFRVIVLSNLKPADLDSAQQTLLARFCSDLGGGVLLIGGPASFDSSWHGSRLEELLPVIFSNDPGVSGLDQHFRLQFTEDALRHSVFQISPDGQNRAILNNLPRFTSYARVDRAKAGAQVWAVHETDEGPKGRRVLMATQRYGAGQSAIICVQNFWRWRLAQESAPEHFDRFWRQFLRFLSESTRQDVAIHFPEQELQPGTEVQFQVERQPDLRETSALTRLFQVRVEGVDKKIILQEKVELSSRQPVNLRFLAERPGIYGVHVLDSSQAPVAYRTLEIREKNLELQNTSRNMEMLRQWAEVGNGLALKAEECPAPSQLLDQIQKKLGALENARTVRYPAGMHWGMLAVLLGSLAAEWILRKKWGLV